jgi:hypothetical protein
MILSSRNPSGFLNRANHFQSDQGPGIVRLNNRIGKVAGAKSERIEFK